MNFVIPYTITDEEYLAFNDHHLWHTPYGRKIVRNCHIALMVFSLLLVFFFWFQHQDTFVFLCQLVGVSVVCGLWLIFFRRSMRKTLRRQIRKSHKNGKEMFSPRGELTVDFEAQTIVDKSEKMTLEVPFSSVEHYYETDSAFYIYIHKQGGFIIPHRLFHSIDELSAFRESARVAFPT